MLGKFSPKTVSGQLVAMLIIVLLIAQMINLLILVGEQRLQARSKVFKAALEHSTALIVQLNQGSTSVEPIDMSGDPDGPSGRFFIAHRNQAQARGKAKSLTRYNERFKSALEAQSIYPLKTFVVLLPDGPQAAGPPPGAGPQRRGPRQGEGRIDDFNSSPPPLGPPPGFNPNQKLQEIRLSAELTPGVWFNAMVPYHPTASLTWRILLATALLLGLTLLAAWAFAKRLSRPLNEFTQAAERLGREDYTEHLDESGPLDIRLAASAFNRMQTRLTRTLDTQRNVIRALGHDLRTPLTSLRIRAEDIPAELGKDKFIATINDMSLMTEEILSWAKDASGSEPLAHVDLAAMLESITDDYQDQGQNVTLIEFKPVTIKIRRISIKRALQNLINNALAYGTSASISLQQDVGRILIHVDDDGPGIPEAQLTEVLKPFMRLEKSRNKNTGGTGLGLSITESIVQIHGGQLILSNRHPKGLRATLSLPL